MQKAEMNRRLSGALHIAVGLLATIGAMVCLVRPADADEAIAPRTDNVVSSDVRTPTERRGQAGAYLGLTGMTSVRAEESPSTGIGIGVRVRLGSFVLAGTGRAGGVGRGGDELWYASLDVGGSYYLSDANTAPFVGAGALVGYYEANSPDRWPLSGTGLGGFGEFGVEFLRASRVSLVVSARLDVPGFALVAGYAGEPPIDSRYIMPLSFNFGFFLH
jgi:hypothetical protein